MTLLPASFGAQRRGSDVAPAAERPTDGHIDSETAEAGARQAVGLNDLNRLAVGKDGRLYWDDTPVVVRRRLQLSPWQIVGANLIALAAITIAISGTVVAAITAHDWMCGAKWVTSYCPAPPPAPPARLELPN